MPDVVSQNGESREVRDHPSASEVDGRAQSPTPSVVLKDRGFQATAPLYQECGRAVCVAVPARDEAARLPTLLSALASHTLAAPLRVLVSVNNSTDGSSAVVAQAAARHRDHLIVRLDEVQFPPRLAHAGSARRRAMDLANAWLGGSGVILTTDADARPPPTWTAANLAAVDSGADMVGGRLELDDAEPLPAAVAALRNAWSAYWSAVRTIEDEVDPRPWDRAPRHGDHTGGSLAITTTLYQRIGGVPVQASGEDLALVRAGLAAGGRLAHPASVWTRVSPRCQGRAERGMALDMAQLHEAARSGATVMAPALYHWRARALWRRDKRSSLGEAEMLRIEAALPPMPLDRVLMSPEGIR